MEWHSTKVVVYLVQELEEKKVLKNDTIEAVTSFERTAVGDQGNEEIMMININ